MANRLSMRSCGSLLKLISADTAEGRCPSPGRPHGSAKLRTRKVIGGTGLPLMSHPWTRPAS
eukprot:3959456-Pyramimonas_sp.AAC.1